MSAARDALKRSAVSPLGAAALAGTTFPLDPKAVAEELGLYGTFSNSLDAVSDRDFALEALFVGSTIMTHLSRLCEEIILWANPNFGYVSLPDAFATGSSIMPQKKNPDVAELMRGKTGRVYGALFGLMTLMKGLPLAYNRDMQEDKEQFFDADRTVSDSLAIMAEMMLVMGFRPEKMRQASEAGFPERHGAGGLSGGQGRALQGRPPCGRLGRGPGREEGLRSGGSDPGRASVRFPVRSMPMWPRS